MDFIEEFCRAAEIFRFYYEYVSTFIHELVQSGSLGASVRIGILAFELFILGFRIEAKSGKDSELEVVYFLFERKNEFSSSATTVFL